ncbi:DNA polymerase III subunit delta' [Methylotenera sp.]|uniref:DNA polymerase III subunit delta' n=1 Tax=Methylotenera sp. TaxID=2051956 RepID=UPI00273378A9|nr:DNA polymerase III subunit delta' [Methylotenera sp.]MDP3211621.1 DNA polymerase III subunit delta' [Methylotenera sp.]
MNEAQTFPWQSQIWERLVHDSQRLPHAILLHGRAGIGKYNFARSFSQALLCLNKMQNGGACKACASCHWFNDESHPDFRLLTPEQDAESDDTVSSKKTKKKTQISVSQIRDLSDFLSLSSHQSSGMRIVLIHPAEALNVASANALLKMLEEPASGVIFILVAHQLQRLLPTIISRCQKINMPVPNEGQSLGWLEEQGVKNAKQQLAYLEGSPIKVLSEQMQFDQLSEIWKHLALGPKLEPYVLAPLLIANSAETGVIAIQKWIYDMVAIKLGQQARYHLQYMSALQALADKVNLSRLFDMYKRMNELRKLASHPLNHELQMEGLLLEYTKIF